VQVLSRKPQQPVPVCWTVSAQVHPGKPRLLPQQRLPKWHDASNLSIHALYESDDSNAAKVYRAQDGRASLRAVLSYFGDLVSIG
jgi:hypothetical protein